VVNGNITREFAVAADEEGMKGAGRFDLVGVGGFEGDL
jgi:hypothetical protein